MDLLLNTVLNLTKEEIQNSKIEFNMQAGSGGQPFLDRWLKHSEAEKMSGTCSDCSYWGWYGKQRNFYPGQAGHGSRIIQSDYFHLTIKLPRRVVYVQ